MGLQRAAAPSFYNENSYLILNGYSIVRPSSVCNFVLKIMLKLDEILPGLVVSRFKSKATSSNFLKLSSFHCDNMYSLMASQRWQAICKIFVSAPAAELSFY